MAFTEPRRLWAITEIVAERMALQGGVASVAAPRAGHLTTTASHIVTRCHQGFTMSVADYRTFQETSACEVLLYFKTARP